MILPRIADEPRSCCKPIDRINNGASGIVRRRCAPWICRGIRGRICNNPNFSMKSAMRLACVPVLSPMAEDPEPPPVVVSVMTGRYGLPSIVDRHHLKVVLRARYEASHSHGRARSRPSEWLKLCAATSHAIHDLVSDNVGHLRARVPGNRDAGIGLTAWNQTGRLRRRCAEANSTPDCRLAQRKRMCFRQS
jgi:hypothetical protein